MARPLSAGTHAKVMEMIAAGETNDTIAAKLHIGRETVRRRREESNGNGAEKAAEAPPQPARETGEAPRKPRKDPKPRSRKKPRVAALGPDDEQLEAMCRKIAVAPAIPAKLVLGCDYCARHFQITGPILAAELVQASHDDPTLRGLLESLYSNWRKYAILGMAASYAGIPVAHHLLPEIMYRAVAPIVGMPPRAPRPHQAHTPGPIVPPPPPAPAPAVPQANGGPPDFPDTPFAGLDLDQLLAIAAQYGIELPDGVSREALEAVIETGQLPDGMMVDDAAVSTPDVLANGDTATAAVDAAAAADADPDTE